MLFTATAEPSNEPPRVRLDLDLEEADDFFTYIEIRRNGEPVRAAAPVGSSVSVAYDYDAPYDVAAVYTADVKFVTKVVEWTEAWASLASWTGSGWSVSGGVAHADTADASIERSADLVQLRVTGPVDLKLELLTAAGSLIATLALSGGNVTLTGLTSETVLGSGDYTLTVNDDDSTIEVIGDSGWSASVEFTGTIGKVRFKQTELAVSTWNTSHGVNGVAVDSASGDIYVVTDNGNDASARLRKFDSAGNQVLTWPTVGMCAGVAVDSASGDIYVIDTTNDVVRKFDDEGTQIASWSTTSDPQAIALDSSGNVYVVVVNGSNATLRKFNSTGTQTSTWAVTHWAKGVAVDSASGDIYVVTDNGAGTEMLRKYNSSGTPTASWTTVEAPTGVALGSGGKVYVTTSEESGASYKLREFDSAGTQLQTWDVIPGPTGLARSADGDFFTGRGIGGSPSVVKYDMPAGAVDDVTSYEPAIASTENLTDTETLVGSAMWLIHATTPSLSVKLDRGPAGEDGDIYVSEPTSQSFTVPASGRSILEIEGATLPVVVTTGPRRIPDRILQIFNATFDARHLILAALQSNDPILLRSPQSWDLDMPEGWFSAGDADAERADLPTISQDGTITMTLTPVRTPVIETEFGITWQDVVSAVGTWADLVASGATWLDLITTGP